MYKRMQTLITKSGRYFPKPFKRCEVILIALSFVLCVMLIGNVGCNSLNLALVTFRRVAIKWSICYNNLCTGLDTFKVHDHILIQ